MATKWLLRTELPAYGVNLSATGINERIRAGKFPAPSYHLGGGRAVWREQDILDYVETGDGGAHRLRKAAI